MCEWEANYKTDPLRSYVNTVWQVILHPVSYFATIKPFQNYFSLSVFIYINCILVTVSSFISQSMVQFVTHKPAQVVAGLPGYLCGIIVLPFVFLGITYVLAGIYHLLFTLVGGSKKDYRTTATVYGLGTLIGIFGIVPVLGTIVGIVYHLLVNIGGQAKAHEISTTRAACSVLLLACGCCCLLGVFAFTFSAFIATIASSFK